MSILGKFDKQPREVEIYAFRFEEDMNSTDELTGGYSALMIGTQPVIESEKTAPYTATLADAGSLIYTGFSVTMPALPPTGYRLAVANIDQDSSINVAGFNVAARGSIIVQYTTAGWLVELLCEAILVSAPDDQRMRLRISGGIKKYNYKAQATVITAEGRQLEDEMILRIKEV